MAPLERCLSRGARRTACLFAMAAALTSACAEGERLQAHRVFTSTVTISLEDTLAIDSAVPLTISGQRRIEEIYATLDATVTASTSTRAQIVADMLELTITRKDRVVSIAIAQPPVGTLEGTLSVILPADFAIEAVERAGTTDVTGVEGNISVISRSHVRIAGAKADVFVGVANGSAVIDAELDPGSQVRAQVDGRGDIQLTVPTAISADVTALVRTSGNVSIAHPNLPTSFTSPGQPYHAVVGGGLSTIALSTDAGSIIIRNR